MQKGTRKSIAPETAPIEREIARLQSMVDRLRTGAAVETETIAEQCEAVRLAVGGAAETVRQISNSEALYRGLMETLPDAVVIADLNRTVVTVNRQAVALFGLPSAEAIVGKSFVNLVSPGGTPPASDFWHQLYETGAVRDWECDLMRLDGSRFPADLSVSLAPDPGSGGWFLMGVVRDLTPRKRAEEVDRQAQRMEAIGQFAGGVAHEFNNLLAIVKGYTELLLRRLQENDAGGRKVRQIGKAADRAAALVSQLSMFSRTQTGEPTAVDVNAALSHLDGMLQRLLGPEIALEFALDPAAGSVLIDPGQFEQIVINLVVNSRDAMPGGGTVAIGSRLMPVDELPFSSSDLRRRPYLLLSVADDGAGMTAQVQSRIFEPFFTTKEVGRGAGLGMAAVYGSVRQAGGHVHVETSSGHGTTVRIYLPGM